MRYFNHFGNDPELLVAFDHLVQCLNEEPDKRTFDGRRLAAWAVLRVALDRAEAFSRVEYLCSDLPHGRKATVAG
jgi:hypothetical protein